MLRKIFQIILIFSIALFFISPLGKKPILLMQSYGLNFIENIKDFINEQKINIGQNKSCEKPIKYTIGRIDEGFNITEDELVNILNKSESIWENSISKDLFLYVKNTNKEYQKDDVLKINLIYDYRQETTNNLTKIDGSLKNDKTLYDSLQQKYTILKNNYNSINTQYANDLKSFQNELAQYNAEVSSWNKNGNITKKEEESLKNRKKSLELKSNNLQITQNKLNSLSDEVNSIVTNLNSLAKKLNLDVNKYNTINDQRGDSYNEGVYNSSNFIHEINVYEFTNKDKLTRILTHEMGHALGLDHLENKDALMYSINESKSLTLSIYDINALKEICDIE